MLQFFFCKLGQFIFNCKNGVIQKKKSKDLFKRKIKWGASSRWSFHPISVWGSIETPTIGKKHPTLYLQKKGFCSSYKMILSGSRLTVNYSDSYSDKLLKKTLITFQILSTIIPAIIYDQKNLMFSSQNLSLFVKTNSQLSRKFSR